MKINLTKKDYTNEILRFCKILTQSKYNAEEDKMFKKFIAENLENMASNSPIRAEEMYFPAETKKYFIHEILGYCKALVKQECHSKEDFQLKMLIAEDFVKIAEIEKREYRQRELKKAEKELAKLANCFGG